MSTAPVSLVEPRDDGSADAVESPRFLRRLLRKRLAVVCVGYLFVLTVIAVVAPIVLPGVAAEQAGDLLATQQAPSPDHLLGTDTLGRDVLERLLVGTQVTLVGVAEALLVVLILGVTLGLVAGFFGGWVDRIIGWVADLTFSMPGIVIILVVLSVFQQSTIAGMVTLGVLMAPGLMRIVRSATLSVREELYIAAAQVSGLSRPYIVARHVLPRIAGPVIVQASLLAGAALLAQTALAFLGLLVPAPAPSWGGMVADGMQVIELQPWLIIPPGLAIALTVLALGLLGDAARDAITESWSAPAKRVRRPVQPEPAVSDERRRGTTPGSGSDALLSIEALRVGFASPTGTTTVLDDVNLAIRSGETVGIVGESGCGKTTVALAILGLLPGTGRIEAGRMWFAGHDLAAAPERELRHIRGRQIGLVSQEPALSLNPAFRVGWQLAEAVRRHHGVARQAAHRRAVELLSRVHLPDPDSVARRYPHELSGGMAQRVAIARALAGEPKLLIADEPTTALDVTVQAEILDLLREIQTEQKTAILLVTHDWGVVADICDRVIVMYAGQIVEHADPIRMYRQPLHPYTAALLAANPYHATNADMLSAIPGDVPKPGHWPDGCHFHPRCPYATAACRAHEIPLEQPGPGRVTRCIHHDQLAATGEGTAMR